jgi:hypothetical protein
MRTQIDPKTRQLLLLLKLDAQRLFERIKFRAPEYLGVFSARRVREHFLDVFKNRYHEAGFDTLMECSEEVIVSLDRFYTRADELNWYLNHTQDMPMKVSDHVYHTISELEEDFSTLNLYIEAELGIDVSLPTQESESVPEEDGTQLSELDELENADNFPEFGGE